ncbi:HET-domain-containing protein [Daldinia vernicosa]|uniref:HET-domain-containing protein n=1 Tax=Daldinia vernicosa TaxID=114800 RepID=UPI002008BFC7|nr:HET-domain-containing protein [Daldinia vernicosa]KAI0854153.1 HET-domain-containing protein [Daldinia vernicosa]
MASQPLTCERCSKIDFERQFAISDEFCARTFSQQYLHQTLNKEIDQYDGISDVTFPDEFIVTLELGINLIAFYEETKCITCKFFDILGVRVESQYIRVDPKDMFQSDYLSPWILYCSKLPPTIVTSRYFDRGSIAIAKSLWHNPIFQDFLDPQRNDIAIFRALPDHNPNHTGIWGRVVPEWVDCSIPKSWLDICSSKHTRICYRPKVNGRLEGFRLINRCCDPITIESCTLEVDYVALSYVWAASPESSNAWPDVVLHAVEMTKQLGFRYLWVDRYCINQENEKERAHQISNMHLIFQQAEVTLVAATDDFDGLSGVQVDGSLNQRARKVQKQVQIGDMALATIPRLRGAICDSNWYKRGWTLQEGLLSRRVLVFTEGELYWNCCGMSERESVYISPEISHLPDMSQQGGWMPAGLFDRTSKGTARLLHTSDADIPRSLTTSPEFNERIISNINSEIWRDITGYGERHLTYDTDSLDAFKGIMQMHMTRAGNNIKFILGLPIPIIPNLDLNLVFGFVLSGLTDQRDVSYRRRHHLPSRSWAGWEGFFYWSHGHRLALTPTPSIPQPQFYRLNAPEFRLITKDGQNHVESTIEDIILGKISSFDEFATLRVVKPYIMRNPTHVPLTMSIQSNETLIPNGNSKMVGEENIAFILIYYDEPFWTAGFLILELVDNALDGTRLWERRGKFCLTKPYLEYEIMNNFCEPEEIDSLDEQDELDLVKTFEDVINCIGLVRSDVDYLIV